MIRMGLMLLLACLVAAPVAADDIKDLDEAWVKAMKAGDIAAILTLYDEAVVFYPPDAVELKGSTAIGKFYTEFLSQFRVKDVRLMDTGTDKEDDLAVSWGRYSMVVEPKAGGAEQKFEGRFTGIAKKRDGKWRYIADHASAVFAPPPPAKPPMK